MDALLCSFRPNLPTRIQCPAIQTARKVAFEQWGQSATQLRRSTVWACPKEDSTPNLATSDCAQSSSGFFENWPTKLQKAQLGTISKLMLALNYKIHLGFWTSNNAMACNCFWRMSVLKLGQNVAASHLDTSHAKTSGAMDLQSMRRFGASVKRRSTHTIGHDLGAESTFSLGTLKGDADLGAAGLS